MYLMKKISLAGLALAVGLLTACNDKESFKNGTQSGEPVMASFKLLAPSTYAQGPDEDGNADENKISVIEFYMFNSLGERDQKTEDYDYSYHKHEGAISGEVSFMIQSGNGKKVLVAINSDLGPQEDLSDYNDLEQLIEATVLSNENSQVIDAGKYVMSGKQTCDIIEDRTDNEVTVTIHRLVAKIEAPAVVDEIVVTIPNEDLQAIFADQTVVNTNISFDLESYAVINGYNMSYVYTNYNAEDKAYKNWDLWDIEDGAWQKTTFTGDGDIDVAYSGVQANSPWLTSRTIFAYEIQPTEMVDSESGITGYPKDEVYAFLLKGKLTNKVNGTSLTRYWRVNLIRDDNYKIVRNTIYRVTLTEVRTIGYGTAKEAEEDDDNGNIVPKNDQTGIQATIEVAPWHVRLQDTQF